MNVKMNVDYHSRTFLASKVIPTLCGQYNNIDIRGIYVRNQQNPKWHCAFLKVYFTKDSKDTIEHIYKQKRELVAVVRSNPNQLQDIIDTEKMKTMRLLMI
jgi:hypothetical protein